MLGGGGPLDPPGPPAVMMKTLEEIEPRKLIVSLPHTITEPGSYYIAKDLLGVAGQHGITIAADNVTLDLGGWSLVGVPGSLAGIYATNQHDIVIHNGTIRLWGGDGIDFAQAGACKLEDLRIRHNEGRGLIVNTDSQVLRCITQSNGADGIATSNGVQIYDCVSGINGGHGIAAGTSSIIRGCYAAGNEGVGIVGGLVESLTVLDCSANDNKRGGIMAPARSLVRNCQTWRNQATGIFADKGSTVIGCTSGYNDSHGIEVGAGSVLTSSAASSNSQNGFMLGDSTSITGCTSRSNAVDGIHVENKCIVTGNIVSGHWTGAGIHVMRHKSRVESNSADDNRRGYYIEGRFNLVVKNSASDNGINYDIGVGNHDALVITPGSAFVSDAPWANFTH
jgi:hypothetical protein